MEFKDRLRNGNMGEDCVFEFLSIQGIPNSGYGWGPQVTEPTWNTVRWQQISDNKSDGDVWFISLEDGLKKHVDSKNGEWIAEDSLENFRINNSYYFMNAFRYDSRLQYFMVRADIEFRNYALNLPVTMMNDKPGRSISFADLPVLRYNSSNKRLWDFDPNLYKGIVANKYQYNIDNNIPYTKIII